LNTGSTSGVTTDVARTPAGGGIVALYLIGSPAHGGGVISNGGSVGIGAGGVTNLEDAGAACGEACGAPTTGCTSQPCSFYFRHLTYLSHSKNRTGFFKRKQVNMWNSTYRDG